MKWKDAPEARELARDVAAATVAVLEEMARKTDVAKAIKNEGVLRAISYLRVAKQAEQEKKLNGLAVKVDAIASFVDGEKAKKTARRPTHLQRILSAACLMNPSREDRRREREAVWAQKAEQARKSDDPLSVFDDMFMK